MEDALKMFLTFLFGSAATAIVQKVLNHRTEKAQVTKLLTETDNQSFTIRTELLQKWITTASNAEEKIGTLREQLAEEKIANIPLRRRIRELEPLEEELKQCQESMRDCKQNHKCSEKKKLQ